MVHPIKTEAQAITAETVLVGSQDTKRESSGPAGGLLIALGASLLLWAVIAQAAKLLANFVL